MPTLPAQLQGWASAYPEAGEAMTDTIKISRELLERLYEASGRGDGMHTDDLRAVRAAIPKARGENA